jgi:HEXXH motif-containing protein
MVPTLDLPKDLTIPEPGSTTARDVLSLAIRRLMVELSALARRAEELPLGSADAAAFAKLVMGTLASAPGAMASVLRQPTVGALVRCLRNDKRPELTTELLATLAVDLAAIGALDHEVVVTRLPARVLSSVAGLGLAIPSDARTLLVAPHGVVVECANRRLTLDLATGAGADGLVSRPYTAIEGGIVLALEDNNPLSMFEAHPDKEGNAIDLGHQPVAAWTEALRGALALIAVHLPELRGEIELYVRQFVPVGHSDEKHLSASYQEAIGTIYLSLHPSVMTMTEAVIHEFSHNKLNALFELDPVLKNAFSPLYASPVRPDPRPLHGILLAVHAFLPVARVYEAMLDAAHPLSSSAWFVERYARIRRINREGAEVVLTHGQATPMGSALLEEFRRWDAHFAAV